MNTSDNSQDDSYIMEERLRMYLSTKTKRRCKKITLFSDAEEHLEVPKFRQSIVVRAVQEVFSSTPTSTSNQRNFFYTEASYNISPINSNSTRLKSGDSNEQTFILKSGSLSDKTGVSQNLKNISKRISSSLRIQLNSSNHCPNQNFSEIKKSKKVRRSSVPLTQSGSEYLKYGRKRAVFSKKKYIAPSSFITLANSSGTSREIGEQGLVESSNTSHGQLRESYSQQSQPQRKWGCLENISLPVAPRESRRSKKIGANKSNSSLNNRSVEKDNTRLYGEFNNDFLCTTTLSKTVNENISKNVPELSSEELERTNQNSTMTKARIKNKKLTLRSSGNEIKLDISEKNLSPLMGNDLNSKCTKEPNEYCKYSYQTYNKKFNATDYPPNPSEKFSKVMAKLTVIGRKNSTSKNETENRNNSLEKTNIESVGTVDGTANRSILLKNEHQSTIRKSKSFTKQKRLDQTTKKPAYQIEDSVRGEVEVKINEDNKISSSISKEPYERVPSVQMEISSLKLSKPLKRESKGKAESYVAGSVVADLDDQTVDGVRHNLRVNDHLGIVSKEPCDGMEPEQLQEYKYCKPLSPRSKKKAGSDDGCVVTNCEGPPGLRRSGRNRRRPPRRIYGVIVTYSERVLRYYNGSYQDKTDELCGSHLVDVNLSAPRRKKKSATNKQKPSGIIESEESGIKKIKINKRTRNCTRKL